MSEPQKHTPGPWVATVELRHHNHKGGFDVSAGGVVICGRAGWPSRVEESAANAHLIASAPDLLIALKTLWLDAKESVGWSDEYAACIDAAIAKAEGR